MITAPAMKELTAIVLQSSEIKKGWANLLYIDYLNGENGTWKNHQLQNSFKL